MEACQHSQLDHRCNIAADKLREMDEGKLRASSTELPSYDGKGRGESSARSLRLSARIISFFVNSPVPEFARIQTTSLNNRRPPKTCPLVSPSEKYAYSCPLPHGTPYFSTHD